LLAGSISLQFHGCVLFHYWLHHMQSCSHQWCGWRTRLGFHRRLQPLCSLCRPFSWVLNLGNIMIEESFWSLLEIATAKTLGVDFLCYGFLFTQDAGLICMWICSQQELMKSVGR
jgi:hypothetical protein